MGTIDNEDDNDRLEGMCIYVLVYKTLTHLTSDCGKWLIVMKLVCVRVRVSLLGRDRLID